MKKILLGACILASASFTACNNSNSTSENSEVPNVSYTDSNFQQADTQASVDEFFQPSTAPQPANNQANVVLNPPHGQPGHVCEIPVGEPLNSGAQSTAPVTQPTFPSQSTQPEPAVKQPTTSTPPMPTSTFTPANSNTGSGKINPPHGQPGHDCAVPVGSPLPN